MPKQTDRNPTSYIIIIAIIINCFTVQQNISEELETMN